VALLVIWIAAVLIIPRTSVMLAGRAVDVPSVDELMARKASFARQLWKEFQEDLRSFEAPPVGPDGDIEVLMAGFNQYMDSATAKRDEKLDDFTNRLNEERFNRQTVQQRVAFGLARVSPTASFSLAAARFAGTSLDLKDRFRDSAHGYRRTFNDFMKEKTGMNVGGRVIMFHMGEDEEAPEPIDPRELPAFQFRAASFTSALADSAVDLGVLAIFNLVFFAGAFIGFLRYDLR
jgi:hypothetical protein